MVICYWQLSLQKLLAYYFLAITTVVRMPSLFNCKLPQIATHGVLQYQLDNGKRQAMFLCILNCLTFVHCYLLQCYVSSTVLNSVARLLVHISTQNLCRFIHEVSYATLLVISTFIATQRLIQCRIQSIFLPVLPSFSTLLL